MWNAVSILTGESFNRFSIEFPLDFTNDLEKERNRILELIMQRIDISLEEISNSYGVEGYLTSKLESLGFGKTSPPCELSIEPSDSKYTIVLKLDSKISNLVIAQGSYNTNSKSTREEIIEGFNWECYGGWISQYNIVNKEKLNEQFIEILENYDFSNHMESQ